jgi:hypothetical protein
VEESMSEQSFKNIQWTAVFLGLALVEAALLYELIRGQSSPSPGGMVAAICIVGILLVVASNVDRIESLSLTKEGFKVSLEKLEYKIDESQKAIVELILWSMGPNAYKNLKKFAARPQGYLEYKKPHYEGLETELYHLRNLGYVELKKDTPVQSIYEIPAEGPRLSDYIEITERGRKYIELRERYVAS